MTSEYISPIRASRVLSLAALAAAAGLAAGMAAIGDIESSYRQGRIAAAALPAPAQPVGFPAHADADLADVHGFAAAAQRRASRLSDCRGLADRFRRGCEDYVRERLAGIAVEPADIAFTG